MRSFGRLGMRSSIAEVALMVSLSNHEGVAMSESVLAVEKP